MDIKIHDIKGTRIAEVISDEVLIGTAQEGLDLLANLYYQDSSSIVLQKENFSPDFFDLKNGLAGEVLQKFSNYSVRLAIVGDFSTFTGKSIQDFIRECNRGKQISFVSSTEEAMQRLSS